MLSHPRLLEDAKGPVGLPELPGPHDQEMERGGRPLSTRDWEGMRKIASGAVRPGQAAPTTEGPVTCTVGT